MNWETGVAFPGVSAYQLTEIRLAIRAATATAATTMATTYGHRRRRLPRGGGGTDGCTVEPGGGTALPAGGAGAEACSPVAGDDGRSGLGVA